ncbi:MAG TPA: PilZ domain-containing protein [Nitrospiria bacterium]|jgi:predicted RNA-binding protein with TRAM domain|nr:PilZ domain-containing protein [Nitrospiria bacterium]
MDKRRKYERVSAIIPAELTWLEPGIRIEANVTMLGRGGMELFAPRAIDEGQIVEVEVHLFAGRHDEGVERVQGSVVWLKVDLDGNAIGVKFTEPLTPKSHPLLSQYLDRIRTWGKTS